MDMTLLYIGGAYSSEADRAMRAGLSVVRWETVDAALDASAWQNLRGAVLVRGLRVAANDYSGLVQSGEERGLEFIVDVATYAFGADLGHQQVALRGLVPAGLVLPGSTSDSDIHMATLAAHLEPPIFVRSELESAAKYVGVAGCIAQTLDLDEVARVIRNLRAHVQGFEWIVARQVVEVRRSESGKPLEYRCLGYRGRLIGFDWRAETSELPEPEVVGVLECAERAFAQAKQVGASGALVIDVAGAKDGAPFVVECKNLQYSSLKNAEMILRLLEAAVTRV